MRQFKAVLTFLPNGRSNAPAVVLWSAFSLIALSLIMQVEFLGGFLDFRADDPNVQAGLRAGGVVLGLFSFSQLFEAIFRITRPMPSIRADLEGLTVVGHATVLWSEFDHVEIGETKGEPHLEIHLRDPEAYERRQPYVPALMSRFKRVNRPNVLELQANLLTTPLEDVVDQINGFHYAVMRARAQATGY